MQRRVSFSSKQKYFWKVVYLEYNNYLVLERDHFNLVQELVLIFVVFTLIYLDAGYMPYA